MENFILELVIPMFLQLSATIGVPVREAPQLALMGPVVSLPENAWAEPGGSLPPDERHATQHRRLAPAIAPPALGTRTLRTVARPRARVRGAAGGPRVATRMGSITMKRQTRAASMGGSSVSASDEPASEFELDVSETEVLSDGEGTETAPRPLQIRAFQPLMHTCYKTLLDEKINTMLNAEPGLDDATKHAVRDFIKGHIESVTVRKKTNAGRVHLFAHRWFVPDVVNASRTAIARTPAQVNWTASAVLVDSFIKAVRALAMVYLVRASPAVTQIGASE